jgi:hypothetical protein
MLVKSCVNMSQLDQVTQIISKADFSAQVIFAYIEALQ